MNKQPELKWSARRDRRLVGTQGGMRHVLVDVTASWANSGRYRHRPPLNLGLVIDASGSMTGEPLAAAIRAAHGVVDTLRDGDRVTVVSFADDVLVHADGIMADAAGRRRALAAIEQIAVRGCTDLGAGWLEGCERVSVGMERGAGSHHRVILLSDGHANMGICDQDQLGYHAAQLRHRGLYTSCVGIGDRYSPVQLQAIAENGGGRLHDAPLGMDIVAVVMGELGEIFATAADDIRLVVRHPRRLSVAVLGPYTKDVRDEELTVNVGTLVAGATRQVVLQVSVPGGAVTDGLELELLPEWKTAGGGEDRRAAPLRGQFTLVPAAELAAERPDVGTGVTVAQMWQKHLLLESSLMNTEGRYEEAARLVKEALPGFREYCRELPGTAPLVRELEGHADEVAVEMDAREVRSCVTDACISLRHEQDFRESSRQAGA